MNQTCNWPKTFSLDKKLLRPNGCYVAWQIDKDVCTLLPMR